MLHPRHTRRILQALHATTGQFVELAVEDVVAACEVAPQDDTTSRLKAGCQNVPATRGTSRGAPLRKVWVRTNDAWHLYDLVKEDRPHG